MTIRDWPSEERPREKLLARGAPALSDAELLAVFLGSGLRGQDAVALGRDLLAQHGGLRGLLQRAPAELQRVRGLGLARSARLCAALELATRHLAAGLDRGEALSDPQRAGHYFRHRLRDLPHEVFACLFLDTRHRVIAFEELFRGTLDGAEVHPREGSASLSGAQRRGRHPGAQPPQRRGRGECRRPPHHACACAMRWP
jgi:DNA repair protein RadC